MLDDALIAVSLTSGAFGTSVVAWTFAMVKPAQPVSHGRLGELRHRARQAHQILFTIEPLLGWMAGCLRQLLDPPEQRGFKAGWGRRLLDWQQKQMLLAGFPLGLLPEELLVLCIASALCTAMAARTSLGSGGATELWTGVGLVVGAVLPQLRLQALFAERLRQAARDLPRAMDLIVLCMSAGLDFPSALKAVSENDRGVVAEEFGYLLRTLELGTTRRAALLSLSERLPSPDVRDFVQTIIQAEAKGASVAAALAQQATMNRQRRSVRAEESAARAGVLMIIPLMMLLGAILVLLVGPLLVGGVGL